MKDILPEALKQLIEFLEKCERELGIQYYLVGGLLVSLYSAFRTTQDIDFVVDLQSKNISIKDYIALLKKSEFKPLQDWNNAEILAIENNLLQYLDQQEYVKLDNYFIDKQDKSNYKKLGSIGLERKVREKIFGITCWVVSKEDYILSKLVFGGWQDYADALGCWMRFNEVLDKVYLSKLSKELGIQKEFNLLISGIDDPDDFFERLG